MIISRAYLDPGDDATLSNVLFGDVYVCGGQSNMQFTVSSVFNATKEIADADNYPSIRIMTVGQGTISPVPLAELNTIEQQWSVASSKTVGVGNWSAFSAACWFFGRDLQKELKIPIGLVSSNWGGTIVQAWSSPDAMGRCKQAEIEHTQSPAMIELFGVDPNHPNLLWNAMIVPFLDMTITGAIWYQGESNSGQPDYYACAFPAMIADWRAKWGGDTHKNFGFYFVQLAPWVSDDMNAEPLTRISQYFALRLPNVGLATAVDLGDKDSPFGSIHPRDKQAVGYRLALNALAIHYGVHVQNTGPAAFHFEVVSQGPPTATVRIHFERHTVGRGLVTQRFTCPVPGECAEYEVLVGSKWRTASFQAIHQDGHSIQITAPVSSNERITGVRYGYANYPATTLYNREGLPAVPYQFPDPIKPSTI